MNRRAIGTYICKKKLEILLNSGIKLFIAIVTLALKAVVVSQ